MPDSGSCIGLRLLNEGVTYVVGRQIVYPFKQVKSLYIAIPCPDYNMFPRVLPMEFLSCAVRITAISIYMHASRNRSLTVFHNGTILVCMPAAVHLKAYICCRKDLSGWTSAQAMLGRFRISNTHEMSAGLNPVIAYMRDLRRP